MMRRRELFSSVVVAGAAACWPGRDNERQGIIDTNVSLFHWPFRRLPLDEPELLVAKLHELGISQAWAGSFEALLHRDLTSANERLFQLCKRFPILRPVGAINLELPDWEGDFERCHREYGVRAVRLHPNYHGYTLRDPRLVELLRRAEAANLWVQIAVSMEDTRSQHPLVQVADVDWEPLLDILPNHPRVRVQLLNARLRATQLAQVRRVPNLFLDTARMEGTDGVATVVRGLPAGRVLFGSHAPFMIPESALIRVHEGELTPGELQQILVSSAIS